MSATNKRFELAVAVPITNNAFKYRNRFSATIDTISSTAIALKDLETDSDSSVSHATEVMVADDRITLKGTTSKTVDTTTLTIVDTTGLTITTTDNMDTDFDADDTIVGYGNAVPGGWYLGSYDSSSGVTIGRSTGSFDNFSTVLQMRSTNTINTLYLYQDIDTDYHVQNLRYRIGFRYKWTKTVGNRGYSLKAYIDDGSSTYSEVFTETDAKETSWTSYSDNLYLTTASPSFFKLYFKTTCGETTVGEVT